VLSRISASPVASASTWSALDELAKTAHLGHEHAQSIPAASAPVLDDHDSSRASWTTSAEPRPNSSCLGTFRIGPLKVLYRAINALFALMTRQGFR